LDDEGTRPEPALASQGVRQPELEELVAGPVVDVLVPAAGTHPAAFPAVAHTSEPQSMGGS
jgi:hypothetical protein